VKWSDVVALCDFQLETRTSLATGRQTNDFGKSTPLPCRTAAADLARKRLESSPSEQHTMIIERLKSGVITVGHGRGFVVEGAGERLVITAAHCLPSLSPILSSFGPEARTYGPLLAPRGEQPRVWAVCRFVDPIADIAVLGPPDNPHTADYQALMETATVLSIGNPARNPVNFWAPALLLSLDDRWFSRTIRHFGGPLWITHAAERVPGAMAGSPIVAVAGTVIGVVCTTTSPRDGGPNARLADNSPGRLLRDTT
jgi:hypothetical protein